MTARSKSLTQPSYRFQRIHASLRSGLRLTVQSKRQLPVPAFFRQGDIDGACGLMCVCMVLVILDLAKSCALEYMTERKFGVPAVVWNAFKSSYFEGLEAEDMVQALNTLGLPIRAIAYFDQDTPANVLRTLMQGELVAIAVMSLDNKLTHHWILGVGVAGEVTDRIPTPDTILALDPSAEEPKFSEWNVRLQVPEGLAPTEAVKRNRFMYESAQWSAEPVKLASAVRFKLVA